MLPSVTIPAFDAYLASRGLQFSGVAIGGAALQMLGVISRETRDCDILAPPLPDEVLAAARAFAVEQTRQGQVLREDWLNNGPATLAASLPDGWLQRTEPLYDGAAITLRVLGRPDLLKTKLFAYCDRRIDLGDCIALAPTPEELAEALPWVVYQDANEEWPAYVRTMFADLARRLGHGV